MVDFFVFFSFLVLTFRVSILFISIKSEISQDAHPQVPAMSSVDQTQDRLTLSGQKRDRSPTPSSSNPDPPPPARVRGGPPYEPLPNIPNINLREERERERQSGGSPGAAGAGGGRRHRGMQRPPRHPDHRRQVDHSPSTATSRARRNPQRPPSPGPRAAAPTPAQAMPPHPAGRGAMPDPHPGSPSAGGSSGARSVSGLLPSEEQAAQMNVVIDALDELADLLHRDAMTDDPDDPRSEDNYDPLARQIRRRVEAPSDVVDELERAMRDINYMVWNNPQLPWTLRRNGPWNEEIRAVLDGEADPRRRYRTFQDMLSRLRREEQQQQQQGRPGADGQRRERIRQLRCAIEDEAMNIDEEDVRAERSITGTDSGGGASSRSGGGGGEMSRHRRVPDLPRGAAAAGQGRSQQRRGARPSSAGVGPGADLAHRNAPAGPVPPRSQQQQRRGGTAVARPSSGASRNAAHTASPSQQTRQP